MRQGRSGVSVGSGLQILVVHRLLQNTKAVTVREEEEETAQMGKSMSIKGSRAGKGGGGGWDGGVR